MTQRTLWRHARLATCDAGMRVIEQGALVTHAGRIEWLGPEASLPEALAREPLLEVYDVGGAWVTPGLIDCHTHLVFAGTRASEYAQRLRGASYSEIARSGGGILSTMRAVRRASEQQLLEESAPRMKAMLSEGVTTIEIKSGYGLTLADEAKMLRVARALEREFPVTVRTTLLAAHAVPPEFEGRSDDYIDAIATHWLPELHAHKLIDAVDIFCDTVGFSLVQSQRVFDAAQQLDLPIKVHAEQLSHTGASRLAAQRGALSCDHLEYANAEDARALAEAGSVAVLLPIAFYCLAEPRKPPVQTLREAGAAMAVATDCNPGSAPGTSLLLAMSMATRLFGLTPEEALAGVTSHAARALGLQEQRGELAVGQAADFVIWNVQSLDELGYWIGFNPRRTVVRAGRAVQ
jgi:imidazolonepropionase